jgi:hypothetical protein
LTPNDLARVGFVLFGAYLIVSGIVGVGNAMTEQYVLSSVAQSRLSAAAVMLGGSLASLVVQGIPGILLLVKGPSWADRFVPPSNQAGAEIGFVSLLAVGLILLGAEFLLGGLLGVAGAAALLLASSSELMESNAWQFLATAVVGTLGGGVMLALGLRMARGAA